jgi:hypothetical protein
MNGFSSGLRDSPGAIRPNLSALGLQNPGGAVAAVRTTFVQGVLA